MANLVSLEAVKTYLGPETGPGSDDLLAQLITAMSAWFERETGRTFAAAPRVEEQIHDGSDTIIPQAWPITEVTSIVANGETVPESTGPDISGWYRLGAVLRLRSYYVGSGALLELSYTAGYTEIPADIQQAVIEMVALKYRERGSIGTSSQSVAGINVSFLPAIVPAFVRGVIEGYRRFCV
jgi:hypothetical protein